ncbi:luciferase [Sulfurimicrobium lacus]|uniref:Luciferase n=1 Tax=Sulfurimicrobium lacus TaxID=2715678 RepID=A0A6F8V877_9PROT|nr:LLM class flavin-dependent oxidoreductase [Sulfurimicrobium lacus]BCB25520.1 luciferase [Sulfurimicrobium lacus]
MEFDIFHEIAMPSFVARSESDAYADIQAEIELADQLEFRCAWLAEHHFRRQYSHCSKPELVLAALSQRTQRIRLGMGIFPAPYHHPVHVAESIATLDILSNGRIEVGLGRGFSLDEYRAFGVDMSDSRSLSAEMLEILRTSFTCKPVSFHGVHHRLDHVDILPHPLQTPHPPLWSAALSPDSFAWVAQQGLGMLAGPFKPWLMTKYDIKNYLGAWGGATPPRIGMAVSILCLPDGKRARQLAKQSLTWYYRELYKTTLPLLEKLYPSYEHLRELGHFREFMKLGINLTLLENFGMVVVGTPAECTEQLRKFEAAGVTHILCSVGAGAVKTEVAQESLRCIAAEVMPAFRQE